MTERVARHAIVTGGGRGIGRAVAAALTRAGTRVTVIGRTELSLVNAVEAGDAAGFAIADVAHGEEVRRAIGALTERFGPADILVSNAGVADSAPFARMEEAMLRRMLDINVFGFLHAAQAVLPGMIERGGGRIVAVASMAGLKGYASISGYCASKHAVLGLVRALALETARSGVTVNAVCPGYAETDIVEDAIAKVSAATGRSRAESLAALVRGNPQGRLIQPAEVAEAVLYFCSEAAGSTTGHALPVAGGET